MKYVRAQWDRSGAVVAVVAGLVALLLGWLGTSDSEYVAGQMPYIVSGGLLGLFLLGIGAVLWLSADLRDEWRQLRVLGEELRLDNELAARAADVSAGTSSGSSTGNSTGNTGRGAS